MMTGVLL